MEFALHRQSSWKILHTHPTIELFIFLICILHFYHIQNTNILRSFKVINLNTNIFVWVFYFCCFQITLLVYFVDYLHFIRTYSDRQCVIAKTKTSSSFYEFHWPKNYKHNKTIIPDSIITNNFIIIIFVRVLVVRTCCLECLPWHHRGPFTSLNALITVIEREKKKRK